MLDINMIRNHPKRVDDGLKLRGLEPCSAELVELDKRHRQVMTDLQELQHKRRVESEQIGQLKQAGKEEEAKEKIDAVSHLKKEVQALEERETALSDQLENRLLRLPNIPDDRVPEGMDESDNTEVRRVGEKPEFDFDPRDHVELGQMTNGLDFEAAARVSGARFVYQRGEIAALSRALGQFMLDLHTGEHGYEEIVPPYLVHDHAMVGTGQLPKFSQDSFQTKQGHWLIPTSEVSVANYIREEILSADDLPMRFTALTPCFRSEAGSAGKDTRGMIRMHQFHKVELISIVSPDKSANELERMVECAQTVLQKLELPYRQVTLCGGDLGFAAHITYDLEVWIPSQNRYREISSCSNCGDFQSRRMMARYRPSAGADTEYVHTLNGSGVATGRALVAIMENYQEADGSIRVPDVLQSYLGGMKKIEAVE